MNLKALHKLTYGMYVVCSKFDEGFNGQIANTAIQVTSNPPTVLVSINRENFTWECIKKSGIFTVSVLAKDVPPFVIGLFGFKSGREVNKFSPSELEYKIGVTGAPVVLTGAIAYFEVKVSGSVDIGSHTIFWGEVVNAEILNDKEPMTYAYYHEIKKGITPEKAATYLKVETKTTSLEKYRCTICGYVYDPEMGDPENNVPPGTPFENLPDNWVCPVCGASKKEFERIN